MTSFKSAHFYRLALMRCHHLMCFFCLFFSIVFMAFILLFLKMYIHCHVFLMSIAFTILDFHHHCLPATMISSCCFSSKVCLPFVWPLCLAHAVLLWILCFYLSCQNSVLKVLCKKVISMILITYHNPDYMWSFTN